MEQGFYKASTNILFAPNIVENQKFKLLKEEKDNYQYPVGGWYWFNSREEAESFFISEGWEKPKYIEN